MKKRIIFWAILFIGITLRLYYAWTAPYTHSNCDNATIYMMANNILRGEFPLFFYGQYYLGPFEALATAFWFKLFGINSFTFYLGTISYSILLIIASYFLGRKIKDSSTGLIVMLYAALPPRYFFWESIAPLGYHVEILLLGCVLFVFALRIPNLISGPKKTLNYVVLGAMAGFGVWLHYIVLYYLVPVALYLLFNDKWKDIFKNTIPALVSFFLSALPFWIFTFQYRFSTFKFKPAGSAADTGGEILYYFWKNIEHMFNLAFSLDSFQNVCKTVVLLLYCIIIVYFVISSVFRKKYFFTPLEKDTDEVGGIPVNPVRGRSSLTGFAGNSITIYLLLFIIIFYFGYQSSVTIGEGYNYVIPIFTFVSVAFGCAVSGLYRKNKYFSAVVFIIIVIFNLYGTFGLIMERQRDSLFHKERINDNIKFLKDRGIYRYYGSEREARIPVFYSNEEIIATAYMDYEYPRYNDSVEAAHTAAFDERRYLKKWSEALDNICTGYNYERGLYYNFMPYPYLKKAIVPELWRAEASNNNSAAVYGFDRNFNNIWSSGEGKKTGMSYTIDLGRKYDICSIEMFNGYHFLNYPLECRIEISDDGMNWKEMKYMENVQPLFWSGPRPYWHLVYGRVEVDFKPISARFVKFVQIGEDSLNPWEFNEICIYEYLDGREFVIQDYLQDADDLFDFLCAENIDFIYADYWLSAHIREKSNGKIQALVAHTEFLPPRENTSREVFLSADKAFAVPWGHGEEFESIFKEFDLSYEKKEFNKYICYYFKDLDKDYESFPSLYWIGKGIVKHSMRKCSEWYFKKAKEAEKKGLNEIAVDFYRRAVESYPNNYSAYKNLVKRGVSEYEDILAKKFVPHKKKVIEFGLGIRFLGYNINPEELYKGKEYTIDYFWTLENVLKDRLYVFVYFVNGDKIIFQNDHEFLEAFGKPFAPLDGEIFKIEFRAVVPEDAPAGVYKIKIGLWDKNTGERVEIINPPNKKNEAVIGEVEIY